MIIIKKEVLLISTLLSVRKETAHTGKRVDRLKKSWNWEESVNDSMTTSTYFLEDQNGEVKLPEGTSEDEDSLYILGEYPTAVVSKLVEHEVPFEYAPE